MRSARTPAVSKTIPSNSAVKFHHRRYARKDRDDAIAEGEMIGCEAHFAKCEKQQRHAGENRATRVYRQLPHRFYTDKDKAAAGIELAPVLAAPMGK